MPGTSIDREESGNTTIFTLSGRFDGASAYEVCTRLAAERAPRIVIDFSRVADCADYGIAVLSQNVRPVPGREVHLRGLRQHQMRLLEYFGVDVEALASGTAVAGPPLPPDATAARTEVG